MRLVETPKWENLFILLCGIMLRELNRVWTFFAHAMLLHKGNDIAQALATYGPDIEFSPNLDLLNQLSDL